MRSAIGRTFARSTSFPVSDSDIRRWAMAVYYPVAPPARFWQDRTGSGLTAPQDFNPFAWMTSSGPEETVEYDPNGPFVALGVDGPTLDRQVNGGMEVEYGVDIRAGDVISSATTISALAEREGRLGTMLFTTTENVWTNQRLDQVRVERMTIIRY
ncbi:MaoC family dehydratase N-terminal domain-containing protein [Rhodococcus fascians]|nr:MaoC family dehydratase N-terminal domain-containing protein [Rhodococcus fascians]MBY4140935.1 MaoC family dehydratase N-terminal domain-containing protein [Rhodococcus fascians]MBY4219599.1 MaoC family dehydratase N-terminal domain-containing protein [Rhodococcus fascians]MBY4221908.1 MaoC family dehydratase N-terminal domain-containing protein [Rhodococcus fascians]MBY4233909.1 MaoC family dehydratase N-terminal domain-containing protein [Rhodococcus fascians]